MLIKTAPFIYQAGQIKLTMRKMKANVWHRSAVTNSALHIPSKHTLTCYGNCTLKEWVVDGGGGVGQVGVKWNANWMVAKRWPSVQVRVCQICLKCCEISRVRCC